ncbi:hypothetical protein CFP56_000400 [Quercus suber]|uniref:Uncharacterized protein n=1 Tax=Quercus suber TaxID=58331 RepID=A0AAW0M9M0_QUESU
MAFENDSLVLNNATNVPNNGFMCARHKLEQIEAYIIVITIFIVFLVVYGSCKRRSHSLFLKILIWIAHVLPTYLITYIFGQMQSASFENELTSLRSEALTLASKTEGLVRNTKLIADFMANKHTLSNEDEVYPSCMKGYKYWVEGVEKEIVEVIPPLYQYHLKTANEVVTIEMIWQC